MATAPLELLYADENLVRRPPLAWPGFSIEHVCLESAEPYEFASAGSSHYLALHDLTLEDSELVVTGMGAVRGTDLRDTLTFVPQGCDVRGWAKPVPRDNAFTALYFDPASLREQLDDRYKQHNPAPFAYVRDASLKSTMEKLRGIALSPIADGLYAESLCLSAALEVLQVVPELPNGCLSVTQLRRCFDYIEAHLGDLISLDQLASAAGLSRFHFSRTFKATTGLNPHAYVRDRRIAEAVRLLTTTDISLGDISRAVGFASPAAFRRVFSGTKGLSPSDYRRLR